MVISRCVPENGRSGASRSARKLTSIPVPCSSWPSTARWHFPMVRPHRRALRSLPRPSITYNLKWGNDLRVDALTAELAVVAVSWSEVQLDTEGHRVDEAGYFTGVAEYRKEQWQLRGAHCSVPVPRPRSD